MRIYWLTFCNHYNIIVFVVYHIQPFIMNMYVANLGFNISADQLRKLFAEFGKVITTKIFTNRQTGDSRGFGFVQMESVTEGAIAMNKLNGTHIEGRAISVIPSREKSTPTEPTLGNE
jgi:RNA recognition motif-containing protein